MSPRIKNYRITHGDGTTSLLEFTQEQAIDYGAVLETDGVVIDSAIRMVAKWNEQAERQGNHLRYSLPFVPSKRLRQG